jgi:nucleotide-binding universal stress UspA family protein
MNHPAHCAGCAASSGSTRAATRSSPSFEPGARTGPGRADRIVVGYDGSGCSLRAVRWSMTEASAHGKPVTVVAVLEPRPVASLTTASIWAPPPESDLAPARHRAEEAVAEITAETTAPLPVDASVVAGHAGR